MIVLHEKGITDYNQKLVSFDKKEHKSEEIMKLNPRGQVPTLKIGDIVINESFASCLYLEKVYANQGNKLIPEDPACMAKVLQRMQEVATFTKKTTEDLAYYFFLTKPEDRKEDVLKTKKEAARTELQHWESYLDGSGSYIAGKDFSIADAIFFPNLAFLVRMGFSPASSFPKLAAYYELVKQRPTVQATWPPHWKTSENQTLLSDL